MDIALGTAGKRILLPPRGGLADEVAELLVSVELRRVEPLVPGGIPGEARIVLGKSSS